MLTPLYALVNGKGEAKGHGGHQIEELSLCIKTKEKRLNRVWKLAQ